MKKEIKNKSCPCSCGKPCGNTANDNAQQEIASVNNSGDLELVPDSASANISCDIDASHDAVAADNSNDNNSNSTENSPDIQRQTTEKSWVKTHIKLIIMLSLFACIGLAIGIAAAADGTRGIKALGNFISKQVLGMKWLNDLIGMAVSGLFGIDFLASRWGGAIQFFIYDAIKIIVLLCFLIFAISYIQSFYPPERTKKILGKHKGIVANTMGALLGTVTPFCSCSSIPIFMGFTRAGLSPGVTFSFLISSPLVDLGAFILLSSIFGFPVAIAYVVVGLILAIIGGTIIDKSGMGKHVRDYIKYGNIAEVESMQLTYSDRLSYASKQVLSTLRKVWIYILIGVGIGAVIHNFIPQSWVTAVLGADKWYSPLIASIVGMPMYADIFGTIPIAEALFIKGVGVGTILSFMMSVTALSLPSMIMLSKAIKPKLLVTFIAVVTVGIISIGYVFNALNFLFI